MRRLLDPGSWQVQFKRLPPRQMLEYHSAGREETGLWNEAGATHSTIKQVGMTRKATIWWLVNATLYGHPLSTVSHLHSFTQQTSEYSFYHSLTHPPHGPHLTSAHRQSHLLHFLISLPTSDQHELAGFSNEPAAREISPHAPGEVSGLVMRTSADPEVFWK